MRKQRKTTIMKRPTPVIGAKGGAFGSNKLTSHVTNVPVGYEVEAVLMGKEEHDQRRQDRFWGLDKDSQDRIAERASMGQEDLLSQQNELFCKQTDLQRKWDREFHRKVLLENRAKALQKEEERQQYLKFLSFAESSEEVISRVWNPLSLEQPSPAFHPATSQSTIGESTLSLPNASSLVGTSVHVDGLQKSRAIVNEAAFSYRETLRKLNSLAPPSAQRSPSQDPNKATQPPEPSSDPFMTRGSRTTTNSTGTDRNPFVSSKKKLNEKVKQLFNEEIDPTKLAKGPVHNEIVDGHVVHKWDQELLLQTAFSRLDKGGKGYLTRTDILAISHDRSVHSLLKFTVFWSFIKKKQWYFFESLFDTGIRDSRASRVDGSAGGHVSFSNTKNKQQLTPLVNRADGHSLHNSVVDGYNEDPTLTEDLLYCTAWLEAATKVSTDFRVSPRHIRSHEEHLVLSGRGTATGTALQQQQSRVSIQERESRLVRKIVVGDCVWALHRSGVVWLPAVVTSISSGSSASNDGVGNHEEFGEARERGYKYNLQFPLNERELQRARATAASRALLELPSQNDSGYIRPKPFESERAANAYAFDLCDATGIGAVELHALVATLHSAEFKKIVETSVALEIIFGAGIQTNSPTADTARSRLGNEEMSCFCGSSMLDTEQIPPLLPVFLDTFSFSANETESGTVSGSGVFAVSSKKKKDLNKSTDQSDSEEEDDDDDDEDKYSASFESGSVATRDNVKQHQKESKVVDFVSKADFLEFCDAVLDLKVYSIKSIGLQQ